MHLFEGKKLRTLRRHMHGEDVGLLHGFLNYHLEKPDDQLPTLRQPGALDFGPRTEAKVKRFQKVNKIDFGTKDYMDGVVGDHTWKILTQRNRVVFKAESRPPSAQSPPRPTIQLPPRPATQEKDTDENPPFPRFPVEGPSKFQLRRIDLQLGGTWSSTSTKNLSWGLQIFTTFLKKADGFHLEHGTGLLASGNYDPRRGKGWDDSKADVGVGWSVKWANIPPSTETVNWSINTMTWLMKSVTDRNAATIGLPLPGVEVDYSLYKNKSVELILMASGGPLLNVELPSQFNNHECRLKAGGNAFFGLTGQFSLFGN